VRKVEPKGSDMKENRLKLIVVGFFILTAGLAAAVAQPRTALTAHAEDTEASAYFAAKCKMCHGAQAEKHFDLKKPDGDFVEAVLKGRDAKPIKMPAYADKGVTEEQAKALVEYMKSLRK
jgi:mono/diheme cytochrome c family protein